MTQSLLLIDGGLLSLDGKIATSDTDCGSCCGCGVDCETEFTGIEFVPNWGGSPGPIGVAIPTLLFPSVVNLNDVPTCEFEWSGEICDVHEAWYSYDWYEEDQELEVPWCSQPPLSLQSCGSACYTVRGANPFCGAQSGEIWDVTLEFFRRCQEQWLFVHHMSYHVVAGFSLNNWRLEVTREATVQKIFNAASNSSRYCGTNPIIGNDYCSTQASPTGKTEPPENRLSVPTECSEDPFVLSESKSYDRTIVDCSTLTNGFSISFANRANELSQGVRPCDDVFGTGPITNLASGKVEPTSYTVRLF